MAGKKIPLTIGRKKLASLGIQLPPLPTLCGSLPKHAELSEIRYKVSKGVQLPAELDRKERLSTEIWIRQQDKMGLDVLSDGEMNRGDLIHYFTGALEGFSLGGTVRVYANHYYRKPTVISKVGWKGPITLSAWKNAQRMTNKPLKAAVTGPYTLMDWSFDEYYPSREALCRDLTAAIKKEIRALADADAKIIEICEPAMSARPEEFSLFAEAIKEITAGVKCYFILQHAYGDIAPLWKKMQSLPVDNFAFEMTNSQFNLLPLFKKHPTQKDITIGVLDSQRAGLESVPDIKRAVDNVLKVFSAGQLWLAPDFGLKTRTIEEATKKLNAMVDAAKKVRSQLR